MLSFNTHLKVEAQANVPVDFVAHHSPLAPDLYIIFKPQLSCSNIIIVTARYVPKGGRHVVHFVIEEGTLSVGFNLF